jgi:xyloglucan-specific exo-beta-1,4-glucanase
MKNILLFPLLLHLILFSSNAQTFSWENVKFQGMGFVTGITSHPADPDFVVARTDVGGNYRWDPVNERWIPLLDAYNAPGVSGDAMSESDPSLLYSVVSGPLLLRSEDRGDTWTIMDGFPNIHVNPNSGYFRWGGKRLVVDPNNDGAVLFYASESDGLWRSADFGASWEKTVQVPAGTRGGNIFVAIDRTSGTEDQDSRIIYAGVQGKGVYMTTDGGINWQILPGGPDSLKLRPVSGTVSSTGILYVTYSNQESSRGHDGTDGRIYKFNGDRLVNITPANNNGRGFSGIDTAPGDPQRIIAIQWKPGHENGIHLSTDGGATWKPVRFSNLSHPAWYPGYVPWTFTSHIMFDRADPEKVWQANGFGVYVTHNIQAVNPLWSARMNNLEEFVAGQVHVPPVAGGKAVFSLVMDKIGFDHDRVDAVPARAVFGDQFGIGTGMDYCAVNPSVSVIVGSQQNNVSEERHLFTTDNGNRWNPIPTIPAGFNNGNIAISATDENRWVWAPHNDASSVPNVQMHYTTDKGKTWQPSSGIPSIRNSATHHWAQSLMLASDRVNGDYFYYYLPNDGGAIYRSNDGGKTFARVYAGLPQHYQCKLKSVPYKEGHLFFHTNKGRLYHSRNYGSSWSEMPGVSSVSGIGFGRPLRSHEDVAIYIAAVIDGVEAIYLSTDYGRTWADISQGRIPAGRVRDITGDLRTRGLVYCATGGRGVIYGKADLPPVSPGFTTYYVSPAGNNSNSGLSPSKAFRTIQFAADFSAPGDTILVMDGEYNESVHIRSSGTPFGWITFKSMNRHGAKITNTWSNAIYINDPIGYIVIDGFELVAPATYGSGVSSSGGAHHVTVRNCWAHHCGESGISLNDGDYRVAEYNIVHDNGWLMPYCGSGISMYGLVPFDNKPGYHSIVRGNISFNNDNGPETLETDGNGIIIDDFRNIQEWHTGGAVKDINYTGRETLVENNVVFNNGRYGITVFLSNNVTVRNNTSFNNRKRRDSGTWRGELNISCSKNVTIVNNIGVANSNPRMDGGDTDFAPFSQNTAIGAFGLSGDMFGAEYYFHNNITFDVSNPSSASINTHGMPGLKESIVNGNHNLVATDPLLVHPGTDRETADFRLTAESPAINAGHATNFAPLDILGQPRPVGDRSDIGAYEYSGGPAANFFLPAYLKGGLKLFPNPVRSVLTVNHGFAGRVRILVYSLSGKLVCTQWVDEGNSGTFDINVEKFQSGVYFLKMENAGKTMVSKFVKL